MPKTIPIKNNQIRVAVTYSPSVGGLSVFSIKEVLEDLEVNAVDADYRLIVPNEPDLDKIYQDKDIMKKVFAKAKKNAADYLQDKDCLILAGADTMIDPRLFGDHLSPEKKIDLARNIAEMALIHVAMQRGMPILGICAGHQLLNVYLGGTIAEMDEGEIRSQKLLDYEKVRVKQSSELAKILNKKTLGDDEVIERFYGAHNELVREGGGRGLLVGGEDYLQVSARANDKKANIEAVEARHGAPLIGVQFHPEIMSKGLPDRWRAENFSLLPKAIYTRTYRANSDAEILKNFNLFKAFKQSAQAFRNKQQALKEIRDYQNNPEKPKARWSKEYLKSLKNKTKPKEKSSRAALFLFSIFDAPLKWIASICRYTISRFFMRKQIKKIKSQKLQSAKGKLIDGKSLPTHAFSLREFFLGAPTNSLPQTQKPKDDAHEEPNKKTSPLFGGRPDLSSPTPDEAKHRRYSNTKKNRT